MLFCCKGTVMGSDATYIIGIICVAVVAVVYLLRDRTSSGRLHVSAKEQLLKAEIETLAPTVLPKAHVSVRIQGTAYLEGVGEVAFGEDEFAGSRGQHKRLEAFRLSISPPIPGLRMLYMAHIERRGDTPWVPEGERVGTWGESLRLEGFAVKLYGSRAPEFDVIYMAHLERRGDTEIHSNGEFCGTRGESRRVEGMLVRVQAASRAVGS